MSRSGRSFIASPSEASCFPNTCHTRYKICKKLGVEPKIQEKAFASWLQAKKYAIDVNLLRRHLLQPKKVELSFKLVEIENKLADERKLSTLPIKGQKGFQPMSVPNGNITGRAVEFVAEKTGMSPRTVARIKCVLDSGNKQLIHSVMNGTTKPSHAERLIRKEEAVRNPIPLPEGKFRVILSDVPFAYDNELEGAPNYPTLTTEEIINLKDKNGKPITEVFDNNCIIFFFSPIPKLEESLKILSAWEFKYKTAIVWSKEKDGKPQEGTGYYVELLVNFFLLLQKERWVNLIGNLTILHDVLNKRGQNNSFADKKVEYAKQKDVTMTLDLAKKKEWKEKEIRNRTKEFTDLALVIWNL